MNIKAVTIGGAFTAVVIGIIYMAGDLVTPHRLTITIVVAAYTLLCWGFGMGLTEAYKRLQLDPPWTSPENRRSIYKASILSGGVPLAALLLAQFWPPTVLQAMLIVIYGVGIGGLTLPALWAVIFKLLWPWLVRQLVRVKWVQTKDGIVQRPADQPSGEGEKTLFVGSPTEAPGDPTEPKP